MQQILLLSTSDHNVVSRGKNVGDVVVPLPNSMHSRTAATTARVEPTPSQQRKSHKVHYCTKTI
jgi:hypothetical protein